MLGLSNRYRGKIEMRGLNFGGFMKNETPNLLK
jgi:hypothetical protein